jgi:uncharacterized protein (DUF952 family)
MIFHLVTPSVWAQASGHPYRAASLSTEGFIHCSYRNQVEWAANRFYAAEPELLVLSLDPSRLTSPVRDEDPGNGELFPHIYGPIQPEAVTAVDQMQHGTDGRWILPKNLPS